MIALGDTAYTITLRLLWHPGVPVCDILWYHQGAQIARWTSNNQNVCLLVGGARHRSLIRGHLYYHCLVRGSIFGLGGCGRFLRHSRQAVHKSLATNGAFWVSTVAMCESGDSTLCIVVEFGPEANSTASTKQRFLVYQSQQKHQRVRIRQTWVCSDIYIPRRTIFT